ncbi:hypothetical protein PV10_01712 [Exophiala mesophila]|uniref:Cupin type-2 domain-containing protein n=1 Tax=Exophiala mesophila TaxID=212818 RepID=A0A0D1ZVM8_EXOME|nr:uncharacterized protein PV10_01712 [Exophiala mesophila]KIV98019.1 hypothetical protein PV10_01712 [Exophiala mesophila]
MASGYLDPAISARKKRDTSEKPPLSTLVPHGRAGKDTINGPKVLGSFTGEVWLDPILMQAGVDCTAANVTFLPGSCTNWHKHERGQYLRVLAGAGWVCDQGEKPRRISAGDVIWCPAGGIHWHGADKSSIMVHEAVSFGGIEWYDQVKDDVYADTKA